MSYSYQVRIRGRLSRAVVAEFEQLALRAETESVETVLYGPVEDQAALHGLIRRIEALGLELTELRRLPAVDTGSPPPPGPSPVEPSPDR